MGKPRLPDPQLRKRLATGRPRGMDPRHQVSKRKAAGKTRPATPDVHQRLAVPGRRIRLRDGLALEARRSTEAHPAAPPLPSTRPTRQAHRIGTRLLPEERSKPVDSGGNGARSLHLLALFHPSPATSVVGLFCCKNNRHSFIAVYVRILYTTLTPYIS